ncbi:hypothetical protein Tcan_06613 [Toxocara canis]|uniref:Uncharacterized protein n=2 Tax=Toxocara canis TaxID=6265 RepID=A0A0B2UXE6_TOXCA|nr:hypothetical protein Tcan_06613 [Toxocara canis]VDM39728.1 unnamed protein product [Toxocara canis]
MRSVLTLVVLAVALSPIFAQMTFTDNWEKRGAFVPNVFRGWQHAKESSAENHLSQWGQAVDGVCSVESLVSELRELKQLQRRQIEIVASIAKCAERSLYAKDNH